MTKKPIAADPKLRDPGDDGFVDERALVDDLPRPAPVAEVVLPVPVVTMDDLGITSVDPYPTGDPKTPQTWAEINGLVPVGTGPLAPVPPVVEE